MLVIHGAKLRKREQNSNKLTIGLLPEAGRKAVQIGHDKAEYEL
jgi:hypothetical protein